ncbi:MAG: hypothetical protein M3P22_02880, partial [bacterium]|nr:hypothetical protein [bacterium]
ALGWDQQSKTSYYSKFVRNPSKKDLESGLYFPRLTGINRNKDGRIEALIKVEFSVPKLLYLNNLDELEEKDFPEVIHTLKDRLLRMGISVPEKFLINAPVSAVHYSKNIQLTEGFTSQYVLSELSKIDMRKSFDFSKTRFMNDGQSIYAYTISHSFVIYDKIADLKKDEKRAIDKDQTQHQRSLFDVIKKKDMYEVLRFEVRLSQKRKMNSLFKKLGIKENPSFKETFSSVISQKIVSHYWQTLVCNNSMLLFSFISTPKDILRQIFIANPKLKPKQALYFTSLVTMTKDDTGTRGLRSIIGKYSDQRTWYRMKDDIKEVTQLLKKVRPRDWFDQIETGLKAFATFKKNGP